MLRLLAVPFLLVIFVVLNASPASGEGKGDTTWVDSAWGQTSGAKTGGAPARPYADEPVIDPEIIIQAKAGDEIAQYKLGYDYYLGKGISQDYAQAAIWWQKAAEQGFPSAQNNLGVLYNSGRGVPQSYAEAYFWENLAAARSNGDLQVQFAKNRDESAARITVFERMRVQRRAAQWFSKHPIPPQQKDSTAPGKVQYSGPDESRQPTQAPADAGKPSSSKPESR